MSEALELRIDDQLCFALYAASNSIVRAYRPLLAELGLSYPQYLVLMVLWERDGVPINEIAHRLDLPPHGVSPVLTRLVQAKLVRRVADEHDGRVVRIHLTARGARLEQSAAQAQAQVACGLGMSPEAYDALRDQLRNLARVAGTPSDADVPSPQRGSGTGR